MLSLKTLGEHPSLPLSSFWWLPKILGVPGLVDASFQSLPHLHTAFFLCISVSVSKVSSYKDTSHVGLRLHSNCMRPHLNLIISVKTLFPLRSHSQVLGHEFWEDIIQPSTFWYLELNKCYFFLPFWYILTNFQAIWPPSLHNSSEELIIPSFCTTMSVLLYWAISALFSTMSCPPFYFLLNTCIRENPLMALLFFLFLKSS